MRREKPISDQNPQRDLLIEFRAFVFREFDSDSKAARHLEMSSSYLSSILKGTKPVPERIAKAFGYEMRWVKSAAVSKA
jgi:hypothetical protein